MDPRRGVTKLSARATDALLAVPDVVSVGVGLGPDGEPTVIVGVRGGPARTRAVLPERVEGLRVVIAEVGDISAHPGQGMDVY